jgi:hypothetical protein
MSTEPESPFVTLEPPPGGIERMRARLAEPARSQSAVWLSASSIAALAILCAFLAVISTGLRGPGVAADAMLNAPQLDRLLGRESRFVPLTVEQDGKTIRTEELPSADPRVRIYRML